MASAPARTNDRVAARAPVIRPSDASRLHAPPHCLWLDREAHQPCSNYGIVSGDYAPSSDGFNTDYLAMGTVPMPVIPT
jgi:hypothetical protein